MATALSAEPVHSRAASIFSVQRALERAASCEMVLISRGFLRRAALKRRMSIPVDAGMPWAGATVTRQIRASSSQHHSQHIGIGIASTARKVRVTAHA